MMEVGATKELGQYSNKQKILLVGEGDFSFSLCLAKAFGSATNITATSLDTREELVRNYSNGKANLEELEQFGCTLIHGINVHYMSSDNRLGIYDRIVFNFPHTGLGFGSEHQILYTKIHQGLHRGFMDSARKMLKDDGEIHLTQKTAHRFRKWKIQTLARDKSLSLIGTMDFDQSSFPGYSYKRGGGDNWDSSFPIGSAVTYMFKK